MLSHLLVPLDGSALSEEALPYARQIIHPKGKITLLTAVELPVVMPETLYPVYSLSFERMHGEDLKAGAYFSPEKLLLNGKTYLEHLADQLREQTELEVAIHVEISEPSELVLSVARELNVDAIVMSTHGHSGFTRWLFGSVTTKVLNSASCPVFVIPSRRSQEAKATSPAE